MIIRDVYLSASARTDIENYKFILYFNNTIDEINLMYPVFDPLKHANDMDSNEFYPDILLAPIIDNILYLHGMGDKYKNEFIRKMKYVFCAWWRKNHNKSGFIRRSDV